VSESTFSISCFPNSFLTSFQAFSNPRFGGVGVADEFVALVFDVSGFSRSDMFGGAHQPRRKTMRPASEYLNAPRLYIKTARAVSEIEILATYAHTHVNSTDILHHYSLLLHHLESLCSFDRQHVLITSYLSAIPRFPVSASLLELNTSRRQPPTTRSRLGVDSVCEKQALLFERLASHRSVYDQSARAVQLRSFYTVRF
jgi:hypothetical protein